MAPIIGTDSQLALDGFGYFIEPHSYQVIRPRVRRTDLLGQSANPVAPGAGSGERYVDRGPAKREWKFIIVAFNNLTTYTGTVELATGAQLHDQLQTSYNKVNVTIPFIDPNNVTWQVHFDDMVEELVDVRSQVDGLQWYMHCTLYEG